MLIWGRLDYQMAFKVAILAPGKRQVPQHLAVSWWRWLQSSRLQPLKCLSLPVTLCIPNEVITQLPSYNLRDAIRVKQVESWLLCHTRAKCDRNQIKFQFHLTAPKLNLKYGVGLMRTGWSWLRIGTGGGCEYVDELSGSKNAGDFLTSCRTS